VTRTPAEVLTCTRTALMGKRQPSIIGDSDQNELGIYPGVKRYRTEDGQCLCDPRHCEADLVTKSLVRDESRS